MMGNKPKGRVISPDMQEKTMTMGKQPIKTVGRSERLSDLAEKLRNRISASERDAARSRGEQGYNPSGSQGARGTEDMYMPVRRNYRTPSGQAVAAKARGEMGYNPSGTQGAKDTEAKWMPAPNKAKRLKVR